MTPFLLNILCEPGTNFTLKLEESIYDNQGNIESGMLVSESGKRFPIFNGIPRFLANTAETDSVDSFGDEWNFFNFVQFKENWLSHTVANTFGGVDVFRDKFIVDAGGGSGSQSKWFLEYGARHVIILELSHSIDGVIRKNLDGFSNVDFIQCSIDSPPIKNNVIDGMVYCHNVIQHTASVENTAQKLFAIVAPGGEFVFNCYPLNDKGIFRWTRLNLVYRPLRFVLRRSPFFIILSYSYLMAILRQIPLLGLCLEKLQICVQGDVPFTGQESFWQKIIKKFRAAALNTFDWYGSHSYQHLKKDEEISHLVHSLQPDPNKVLNTDKYFSRPAPIGCALRVFK